VVLKPTVPGRKSRRYDGNIKNSEMLRRSTYCTVSVKAKDCTVLPAALAVICTVEDPAGVEGVLGGVLGGVPAVEDPPPPHPLNTSVPASKASATTQ
jgi:hypothetical protein